MFLRLLCMICWVLVPTYTQASVDSVKATYAYIYSETPSTLTGVRSSASWKTVPSFPNNGFKPGEYWLRAKLHNPLNEDQTLVYRLSYPLHDEVDFFEVDSQGRTQNIWQQGDMRDQSQHHVMDKHAAIKLRMEANESIEVYVRVASKNALVLATEVLTEFEHEKHVHFEAIFSSLIYGVLLIMGLYNLGLAITLRDKAYFSYVFYVMTFTAFLITLNGDGYYYLWNESPKLNQYLLPILSGMLIIPSLLFPYYLLHMKSNVPLLARMYQVFMVVAAIFVLSIPVVGVAQSVIVVNTISSIFSIIMLFSGIYMAYKKIPLAGLYSLAWLILLVGLSVLSVSSLGLIESNLLTRNAGLIGGVIEAIILSLALAQRIAYERRDKLNAIEQASQNRKLFQELFEKAPVGIMRFNLSGEVQAINPALAHLLEYDSTEHALKQLDIFNNLILDFQDINRELTKHGKLNDKHVTLNTASGKALSCSVSLHLSHEAQEQYVEAYITDISERLEVQKAKEAMEYERLSSMEHLITGVAHEVNTPLGVNITSVSHINEILSEVDSEMKSNTLTRKKFIGVVDDVQQLLHIVTHNLNKMSNIVRRFKLVSLGKTEKAVLNFKRNIEQSLYSHHLIDEDINIKVMCESDMNIESYPAAWNIIIEQLVENSIVHGFTPDQSQKTILIQVTTDEDNHWVFDYSDNGKGLHESVREKVFHPFVTTKRSSSDHAGLGLFRIYNLVQRVLKGSANIEEGDGFHLTIRFHAPRQMALKSA